MVTPPHHHQVSPAVRTVVSCGLVRDAPPGCDMRVMWQASSAAEERVRARSVAEHRGRAGAPRFVVQHKDDSDEEDASPPRRLFKSVSCEVGVPRTLNPEP